MQDVMLNMWVGDEVGFPTADNQISITEFQYSAKRMGGAPSISATLYYSSDISDKFSDDVYVLFNGERFYLSAIPDSAKSNDNARYKYDVNFVSERIALDNVYFFNVVKKDESSDNTASNNSVFSFFGDVTQFAERMNRSMQWSGLDGYTVVVDSDVVLEEKLIEFQDSYLSDALNTMYDIYKTPYYFVGKTIHIGYAENVIDTPFRYGRDNELLSISKNKVSGDIVNRITARGSDRNIPYYYPNPTPKGYLSLAGDSSNLYEIVNAIKFSNEVDVDRPFAYSTGRAGRLTPGQFTPAFSLYSTSETNVIPNDGYYAEYKIEVSVVARNIASFNAPIYIGYNFGESLDVLKDFWVSGSISGSGIDAPLSITPNDNGLLAINGSIGSPDDDNDNIDKVEYVVNAHVIRRYIPGEEYASINIRKIDNFAYEITSVSIYESKTFMLPIDVIISRAGDVSIKNTFTINEMQDVFLECENVDIYKNGSALSLGTPKDDGVISCGRLDAGNYSVRAFYRINGSVNIDEIIATSSDMPSYTWRYVDNGDIVNFDRAGLAKKNGAEPSIGDTLIQIISRRDNVRDKLMPSIYRESKGENWFYNAENGRWPGLVFANPYSLSRPREYIYENDSIYPTIEEVTNASGKTINQFIDIAYDDNDNDEIYPEGHAKAGKYVHPYFYVKLRKFNGANGFNLFDCAIYGQAMAISMLTGDCGGCEFNIGVDEETGTFNPVQVDDNGDLLKDSDGRISLGPRQQRQNDTAKYEVWVALKKDDSSYGVLMPSGGLKPTTDDTFTIIGIDLPKSYYVAAEKKLETEALRYMADNNDYKYSFSASVSSIFFKENPDIANILNENAAVTISYGGTEYTKYISSFSYKVSKSSVLPAVTFEAGDIEVYKGQIDEIKSNLRVAGIRLSNNLKAVERGLDSRILSINKVTTAQATRIGDNRQDIYKLSNVATGLSDETKRILSVVTVNKNWQDAKNEELSGVAMSAMLKVYKEALVTIEAELASIESLLGQGMPKPIEWLDYLDAYSAYKNKIETILSLNNPNSINIAGIDVARSKYIVARDALLRALGVDDARTLSKQIYEGKIAEVTAQRDSILQELYKITGEGYVLVDSEGNTLSDSTGALLYEFADNSEYGAYNNAANDYIAKMREMIDTLNFVEDDDYKAVSEAYYAQYNNITSKKANAQSANIDFIRQYIASTTLSSDVIWTINTNINTELLRLFYDAIVMELDIYEKKYPDIPFLAIPVVDNYKVAAKAFIDIIWPILKNATSPMCQLTTSYKGARDEYRIRRNALILYEIQNK